MKLVTISVLLLLLDNVLGHCNNTKTTSLIKSQLSSLQKTIDMLDNGSKCRCHSINQVVFLAEIGSGRSYQKGSVWIYDKVVTNVGNAYNPSTGIFTAPTKGIYQFNWYTLSVPSTMSHAELFVNGKLKARQSANNNGSTKQWITAGSSVALPLNKGDVVHIMDSRFTAQLINQWTTFGGVLLN
ncbi:complement C1q-like protein 4 [Crassostrea angulata]|uniref:complement C1q-like protein 4 n=1 Tax=Magallana angulata TaxID=2784310 RepID=UPI0022B18A92|nr:complement C1q-like protein 4 [Crassostrea angulata]